MARYLAIDVDAHGLFVTAASLRGRELTIEHALAVTDEAAPITPANATDLGARLKALLHEAGVKPAPVLLCVGRDRVIPKVVRHPPTSPAEEPAVVRFQAQRELTDNADDVVMDYTPIGEVTAGERQALAVFVRKQSVQAARQFCEAAGLKLAAMTPRPFAAIAAARHAFTTGATAPPDDPTGPIAVVTLGDLGGEFTVSRGPDLTFSRTIPSHALASEAALTAELKRNLAVYDGQYPAAPVETVYLAEPDTPGSGWAGRVRSALLMPVHVFDPLAGAATGTVPTEQHGRFAGPVGLLAARASNAIPVNFVQTRQPRAESSRSRPRILLGVLAVLLLVAMVGTFGYLQVDRADREVRRLTAQRNELDEDLKRLELDGKRLAAADEFAQREVVVLDTLYDLTVQVPDVNRVKVAEFDLTALPPPKKATRPGAIVPQVSKNAPPPPVATMKVAVRSTDPAMVQRVFDAIRNDRYSVGATKTTGMATGQDRGQSTVVVAQVLYRSPGEYVRELNVQPPAAENEDRGNVIIGGFEP